MGRELARRARPEISGADFFLLINRESFQGLSVGGWSDTRFYR